jgi:hypothetical protein
MFFPFDLKLFLFFKTINTIRTSQLISKIWIWKVYLKILIRLTWTPFYKRRSRVAHDLVAASLGKISKRAYILPLTTALRHKRRRPSFQIITKFFIKRDLNRKRLDGRQNFGEVGFKNRQRRYGNDSSESGHTQYAFPKKGNASSENFTS